MPTYTLNLTFDAAGLNTLTQAGQQVAIVKSPLADRLHPVIWLAFHPELNNTVNWAENYEVYASNTIVAPGHTIVTSSVLAASAGNTYNFAGGQFDPNAEADLGPTEYGVFNGDSNFRMLTTGLMQQASGTIGTQLSPLNASITPYNNTALFEPIVKLWVFTYAGANNGKVISSVTDQAVELDFTETLTHAIKYDAGSNQFVQVS